MKATSRVLPLRQRPSSSRVLAHLHATRARHWQQRWGFATHAAGPPGGGGGSHTQVLGLQGMQQFHMEKLSGWEQAVHHLAASDCEPLSLSELLALADDECRAKWESLSLGYPPSRGDEQLLAEIADGLYAGSNMSAENILGVVPAEGILLAMHALLSPGDHAVVVSPCYASLRSVAEAALGCTISPWCVEWQADGRPTLCIDKLRQLVSQPGTTLLIVNFPHNPTGFVPSLDEWSEIVRICDERGIWLFSDEMYRHLERHEHGCATLPSAAESYSRGVTLSGLSKAYGLPGLRVGWLASRDEELVSRCFDLKDYTTICASRPSECLALMALRNRRTLWDRCNSVISHNTMLMDDFVQGREQVIEWRPPLGGPVALPRLLSGGAVDHCTLALQSEGVMLIPDREFGTAAEWEAGAYADDRLRIGLGRKGFAEMLQAWGRVLDASA
jgi:aspartate/methionine/tyrosine aminotransferase